MKRFIQFVCIALIISTVLLIPVSATESMTPWGSSYFVSSLSYLHPTVGTQFQVWIEVRATGMMEELGASSVTVQRSPNNSTWTDMQTYTKEDYSQLVAEDDFTHEGYVTYDGTSGYYYRAKVWFYAKKGTGTAEYSYTTDSIYVS